MGWAVQWGTARMLGTFLTEDPLEVPGAPGHKRPPARRQARPDARPVRPPAPVR
ncbi:hypothetical protein [Nonomuraea bangladeshensis]|uniref:hypothetical protein n=1 Tax=Nonomuraea bangladeshensis TaxID=404385 RepID=UPI003C3032C6